MDMDHYIMYIQFQLNGLYFNTPHTKFERSNKDCKKCFYKKQENKKSFTFVGVGDNLYHGAMYWYPYQRDGYYNFDSYYEMTNKYTQNADLAYINFETLCIGEEYELSGYPTF